MVQAFLNVAIALLMKLTVVQFVGPIAFLIFIIFLGYLNLRDSSLMEPEITVLICSVHGLLKVVYQIVLLDWRQHISKQNVVGIICTYLMEILCFLAFQQLTGKLSTFYYIFFYIQSWREGWEGRETYNIPSYFIIKLIFQMQMQFTK